MGTCQWINSLNKIYTVWHGIEVVRIGDQRRKAEEVYRYFHMANHWIDGDGSADKACDLIQRVGLTIVGLS